MHLILLEVETEYPHFRMRKLKLRRSSLVQGVSPIVSGGRYSMSL